LNSDYMEEFMAAIRRAITEVSKECRAFGLWPSNPCVHLLHQDVTCPCDAEQGCGNGLIKNRSDNYAEGVSHWIGKYKEPEKKR
ncbi:hypothetical protein PMAYCL1PPCAC_25790, partial [Pristionchus mayeri]